MPLHAQPTKGRWKEQRGFCAALPDQINPALLDRCALRCGKVGLSVKLPPEVMPLGFAENGLL